jgi:hypothetical protein
VAISNLRVALTDLANYIVERMPEGWLHASLEIVFVDEDVVQLSGTYGNKAGDTTPLSLDYDVVEITDTIRSMLSPEARAHFKGLHLSLESDGSLSTEFLYPEEQ